MAEIAEIGFRVDSEQLKRGTTRLDRFKGATARADRQSGKFTRTIARNGTALTATNGAVNRLAGGMSRLAGVMAATFGGTAIVRTLAGFEGGMSQVAAITRASSSELEAMNEISKKLGGTTEFSAAQAASGLKFLGMAGFTAAQSIEAIPQVLDLATAAAMDLGRAADITSNIMSAFGIDTVDTARVTDVLAAASSRANTDVSQLGDAIKFVGPIASAAGIGVGETAAAIGALSDAGLQGTLAGTGLRKIIASLISPTKEASETIAGMGLTLEELNPETNSFVEIVNRLADAGLGVTEAFEIFGIKGAPAIQALIGNRGKLAELTGTLSDVSGEATRMATIMRDNLQGDLRNVASASEAVVLSLGEAGLTDTLRVVTQGITGFLRAIAEHGDIALGLISAIAAALGVYATAALSASAATGALAAAIAVITGPIGLLALGVGAVAGAFVFYKTRSDDAGRSTIGLANAQETLNRLNETVTNSTNAVSQSFVTEAAAALQATDKVLELAQAQLTLAQAKATANRVSMSPEELALRRGALPSFDGAENMFLDDTMNLSTSLQNQIDAILISRRELQQNLFTAADLQSMNSLNDVVVVATDNINTFTATLPSAAGGIDQMTIANDNFNSSLTETNELYDTARTGFAAFFEDMRTGLRDGKSLVDSLSGAFTNYLDKIASKALEMAANGIWDMIFGAIGAGIGGGLGSYSTGNSIAGLVSSLIPNAKGGVYASTGLSAHANTVVSSPTVFPFAKGGTFGLMGEAGPEAIIPLSRNSSGELGVKMQNGSGGGGFVYEDKRTFNLSGSNLTQNDLVQALKKHDEGFNQRLAQYKNDPRVRRVSGYG